MPNRNGPTHHGNGPSETFVRARSRPPNQNTCLGTAMYTERYMQPSPAQPSPGHRLGFAVGACLFPLAEPGHSRE